MLHMKGSDIDELHSCERYVNKRSRTMFCTKKNCLHCCYFMWELFVCNKENNQDQLLKLYTIDMGKLHDVDLKKSWFSHTLPPTRVRLYHDFVYCLRIIYRRQTKWWFSIPQLSSKVCAFSSISHK